MQWCHLLDIWLNKVRSGSIKGSVFNLIWGILGTGMLTLPVVCHLNGIIVGLALIILGGFITKFSSMWIVIASGKVNSDSIELMAEAAFGPLVSKIASYSMIMWLLGYVVSYTIVIKTLLPYLIKRIANNQLPQSFVNNESLISIIIPVAYTLLILLPFSLPRKIGALRFTSLLGFICWLFLVGVITCIFIFDRTIVPQPIESLKVASYFKFSPDGMITTFPFIIYSYMYQPMVPTIYKNLEKRNLSRMEKVLIRGTYSSVILYLMIAVFGYLTFVNNEKQLLILEKTQNILELDYQQNIYFDISLFGLTFTLMVAGPVSMIPCKDTIEDVLFGEAMTDLQNVLISILLTWFWCACALILPGIADILTILGLTCNPLTGYFLPILIFLKLSHDSSIIMKATSVVILVVTFSFSVYGIYNYIALKIS